MAVTFEGMERRMPKIEKCLAEYGIANLEEARKICNDLGFDPYDIVKGVQPIAFENAGWAYTLGCAVAQFQQKAFPRRERLIQFYCNRTVRVFPPVLRHFPPQSGQK